MLKRIVRQVCRLILFMGVIGLLGFLLPRLITLIYSWNRIYAADSSPSKRIAIIFGAGLRRDGTPTAVLRDRVETGAKLYFNGKVEKMLLSGDNQYLEYNEPEAMRQYALSLGIPDEAITLDYAGRRTYDTCYRAKEIFGITSAVLVTQRFHLPRALFICNALGVESIGVEANNRNYWKSSLLIWNLREHFATVSAFWDLFVDKPPLILGKPEQILLN